MLQMHNDLNYRNVEKDPRGGDRIELAACKVTEIGTPYQSGSANDKIDKGGRCISRFKRFTADDLVLLVQPGYRWLDLPVAKTELHQ